MPTMCELMRYEPLLLLLLFLHLLPPPTPPQTPHPPSPPYKRKDWERGAKGDSKQGRTRTGQHSLVALHGGLDARSMYEKLTMLNLQSGSNWSGPNNWYHDPTGVQTQHSTGEEILHSLPSLMRHLWLHFTVVMRVCVAGDSHDTPTIIIFFCHLFLSGSV